MTTESDGNGTQAQTDGHDGLARQLQAAQASARMARQAYREVFDAVSDMIAVHDAETGEILEVNKAALDLTGYTREDYMAKQIVGLSPPGEQYSPDRIAAYVKRAAAGEPQCFEWGFVHRSGEVRQTEVRLKRANISGRKCLLACVRDITEQKREEKRRTEHEEQLRHLSAQLSRTRDDERRRISDGLHDDVAQTLVACAYQATLADRAETPEEARAILDELRRLLKQATDRVRSLSFELAPRTLYVLGLSEAIRELCDSMSARFGMKFTVMADDSVRRAEQTSEVVLFNAARELLFNVVKHAGVKGATVSLTCMDEMLALRVSDRGAGLTTTSEESDADAGGLGLHAIRGRLRDVQGQLTIDSVPGGGTAVSVRVPLRTASRTDTPDATKVGPVEPNVPGEQTEADV
jgi:PAS domain S-box-containing protein